MKMNYEEQIHNFSPEDLAKLTLNLSMYADLLSKSNYIFDYMLNNTKLPDDLKDILEDWVEKYNQFNIMYRNLYSNEVFH